MNAYIENQLPDYDEFNYLLSAINLEFGGSEIHGILCGFLCAQKEKEGEDYLRALLMARPTEQSREAALLVHQLFACTQHQLNNFDFSFRLFLPDEDMPLRERAQAFSEWCVGFLHALAKASLEAEDLETEESQDLIEHIEGFAELDYESLSLSEEDEKALMEVTEYTRMAVLQLFAEIKSEKNNKQDNAKTTQH